MCSSRVIVRDAFPQQNRVLARRSSCRVIVPAFDRSSARFVSRDHLNLFTYRGKMMRSLVLCPPFLPYEYANQFNRAVGRSKKIIGAGRLFKIRGTANRQWFSILLKYRLRIRLD